MNRTESIKAYAAWGAVCLFWGTTYLAIRIGVRTLPPALFTGIRFAIAGMIFLGYLQWRGFALPKRQDLWTITVVGIALLAVSNGLVVWAEQWVPSGLAALLVATLPFWMAGFEAALPSGSRLSFRKIFGILIGFAGLLMLFGPPLVGAFDKAYFKGVLGLLLAPCCWAAGSVYSKYRPIQGHPLMGAAFQMIIAGVILIGLGAVVGEFSRFRVDPQGLAALMYLVVFGSIVGYGSFMYALAKLPATKVSMYAYVNPVIAVLLGWLVLGEQLDSIVALSTAIILFGVVLVKTSKT